MGRIAATYGEPLEGESSGGLNRTFPNAEVLAKADLASLGMPRARAETINRLAAHVAADDLSLAEPIGLEATVEHLRSLSGIGDWTAQYIAMRALGEPDAFPAGDLGVRRALAVGGKRPTIRDTAERAERWRPWRAYAVMYLWTLGIVSNKSRRN